MSAYDYPAASLLRQYTPANAPSAASTEGSIIYSGIPYVSGKQSSGSFPLGFTRAIPNLFCGYKALLLGDSHLQRGIGSITTSGVAGTVVSDGTTVTFTTASTHYLDAGMRVTLFANSISSSITDLRDGLVVEVTSAVDTTHFTIDAAQPTFTFTSGDWSQISGVGYLINLHHHTTDFGIYTWINAYLTQPFITVAAYCAGGATADRYLSKVENILKGQANIDYWLISLGFNDLASDVTADNVLTKVISLVDTCLAMGSRPIILIPPPLNSNAGSYTTARSYQFSRYRHLVSNYIAKNSHIIGVDLFGITVDSQSSTANYKTGYDDPTSHLHVNINKCAVVGKAIAAELDKHLPSQFDYFPVARTDAVNVAGAVSANRISNPMMSGGGAGSLPTDWLNSGGSATVTTTGAMTNISGYGWSCRQEISGTAGQDALFRQSYTRAAGSNWYIGGMEIEVVTGPVNLRALQLELLNQGTTYYTSAYFGRDSNQSGAAIELTAGDVLRIVTQPTLDTGKTANTQQLRLHPILSGVGSADIRIGRAFVYPVANPYET